MKVIFLTTGVIKDINQSGLYTDLLRCFYNNGHKVFAVSQLERRLKQKTFCEVSSGIQLLRVKTGNITKTRWIEKGISTLLLPLQYYKAINAFWKEETFDLILYSTPPITFEKMVEKIKKHSHAFSYLLLKDIFPQNAVDLGILKKTGIESYIYKFFKTKERKLYNISDKIGCMSPANINYIRKHNPQVKDDKLELCPNTINNIEISNGYDKNKLRKKHNLPHDKIILLYGGNFGKPQNVAYIIDVLRNAKQFSELHFVMCGSGTDFDLIKNYVQNEHPPHVSIINSLPFHEYTDLLKCVDIGLIFLDYRFTIPNFPSRIVDYMNYSLPILASTDTSTDLGNIIKDNKLGWWCESNSVENYLKMLHIITVEQGCLRDIGKNSKEYMKKYFTTEYSYTVIENSYKKWRNEDHV